MEGKLPKLSLYTVSGVRMKIRVCVHNRKSSERHLAPEAPQLFLRKLDGARAGQVHICETRF